ncbi:3-oxoadipate enol-lactonase [Tabrizicola oligotrophica]|uniref:3-oxoadipate enol-lactonase n=1 Tax=Tabrizicola oligotrophica TaxID=2710650 RepID=A0A6M0QU24_9RHOB|nr:3-oxoadipate enol-lactonase [Tabrizicola oligotrophica]NEY89962.1 3-oxoadipate enol-lactonase [Tabrizicola oligotrophica]
MQVLTRPWGAMHYRLDGAATGKTVVFANSLGTDLRLWDALVPLLPKDLRLVRYDKRGHGLSDLGGPVSAADLADDAAALIDHLGGPVVFVGLSIGGLIAQALAARRPDLLHAVVISNSAAKLGTPDSWRARIDAVRAHGLASIADAVMERWFAPAFRNSPAVIPWRNMMIRTPAEGYIAACGALAAADQTEATRALRLPALVIAGAEDGSTPPDLVRATAALIPGAEFHVIPGTGHLPCVENPAAYAAILTPFLKAHA